MHPKNALKLAIPALPPPKGGQDPTKSGGGAMPAMTPGHAQSCLGSENARQRIRILGGRYFHKKRAPRPAAGHGDYWQSAKAHRAIYLIKLAARARPLN